MNNVYAFFRPGRGVFESSSEVRASDEFDPNLCNWRQGQPVKGRDANYHANHLANISFATAGRAKSTWSISDVDVSILKVLKMVKSSTEKRRSLDSLSRGDGNYCCC